MCTLPGGSGTHDDGHSRVYRSCTGCVMIEKVQLLVQRQSPRSLLTLALVLPTYLPVSFTPYKGFSQWYCSSTGLYILTNYSSLSLL